MIPILKFKCVSGTVCEILADIPIELSNEHVLYLYNLNVFLCCHDVHIISY